MAERLKDPGRLVTWQTEEYVTKMKAFIRSDPRLTVRKIGNKLILITWYSMKVAKLKIKIGIKSEFSLLSR